jgi:hypothetical protein
VAPDERLAIGVQPELELRLRWTWYPVAPAAAVHETLICDDDITVATRVVGAAGATLIPD